MRDDGPMSIFHTEVRRLPLSFTHSQGTIIVGRSDHQWGSISSNTTREMNEVVVALISNIPLGIKDGPRMDE